MINISHLEVRLFQVRFWMISVWTLKKGEVVALIGSSGAGSQPSPQPQLLWNSLIAERLLLTASKVDFQKFPRVVFAAAPAMVFQQFNLFSRRTALENVKEGLLVD